MPLCPQFFPNLFFSLKGENAQLKLNVKRNFLCKIERNHQLLRVVMMEIAWNWTPTEVACYWLHNNTKIACWLKIAHWHELHVVEHLMKWWYLNRYRCFEIERNRTLTEIRRSFDWNEFVLVAWLCIQQSSCMCTQGALIDLAFYTCLLYSSTALMGSDSSPFIIHIWT